MPSMIIDNCMDMTEKPVDVSLDDAPLCLDDFDVSKHDHVIEINRHSFSWGIKIEDDEEKDNDKKQEKKERKSKGKKAIKKDTSGIGEGILEEDSIENSDVL